METALRVLILDDSEDDTLLLVRELKRGGYAPTYERADTALAMHTALAGQSWDIILSDYSMPAFSALDALALLHDVGLDLPFIIVSGTLNEVMAVDALKAGAHDFVVKGNFPRLVPAIERELREAQARSELRHEQALRLEQETSFQSERKQADEALRVSEERLKHTMDSMLEGAQILGFDWQYLYANDALVAQGKVPREALFGHTMMQVYPGVETTPVFAVLRRCMEGRKPERMETEFIFPDGSSSWFDLIVQPVPEGIFILSHDITERRQAESALAASEKRFRALIENSADAIALFGADGTILYGSPSTTQVLGYALDEFVGLNALGLVHPDDQALARDRLTYTVHHPGERVPAFVRVRHKNGAWLWMEGVLTNLLDDPGIGAVVNNYRDITERKRADDQIQNQLARLAALREIDRAISGSLDLKVTLNICLGQVVTQLGVDAADVLLLEPQNQVLEYAAGRGFRSPNFQHVNQRVGEGRAGQAALERRIVTSNLRDVRTASKRTGLLGGDAFDSYYGVPLIAKGQMLGVLEIFQRSALQPAPEWLVFLEALAGQAAIAIDNARLFDNLRDANQALVTAYDATIEGWSRALDLRDKETEGHSQRVTELTEQLALSMGMGTEELVHVRRGALLHDIGKMGVPDAILLKPGPLTDDEWVVMRQHPTFAYAMLEPIRYLRPALEIPYCHHEKWNGSGYPRGLKADQIPLAARIFAVADVWDALRSDRPYRPAWPAEKVREYIRDQAGKHFDPAMGANFLNMDLGDAH